MIRIDFILLIGNKIIKLYNIVVLPDYNLKPYLVKTILKKLNYIL